MKPTDALRLPRARLTNEQRKTVATAIGMLEGLLRIAHDAIGDVSRHAV